MKNMKTIKRIIPVLLILCCISCERNIFDITPQDRISDAAVWNDEVLMRAYLASLYNGIPHGMYDHNYGKYTDETYNTMACCCCDQYLPGVLTPDNIENADDLIWCENYMYYWNRGYEYIRKVNIFLEKMEETDLKFDDKDQLIAEAKFIRGFIYFELIKRFGGVPIVDKIYSLGDDVQFERNTFDECVTLIENDLTEAIPDLKDKYASTSDDYGKATADACYALLSRVYLYAASPLHNPSNDKKYWQKAADAAEALFDKGYSLYPDYHKLFELNQGDEQDEVIFSRGFSLASGHRFVQRNINARYGGWGGWWGSSGPSQNLVDDYDMTNGEPPFLADGTINPASGYDTLNPYANRDPRFDATIIHDETVFRGDTFAMWISEDGSKWGFDSYKTTGDNPRTNTVMKKFMPSEGEIYGDLISTNQWPYFRLAEIYLNYAEAQFELGNEAAAREYVSKVRARTGVDMPPIPETVTGEELRRRIYNERRIELAFENQRFFDVRRWKIGIDVENLPIRGLDVFLDLTTGVKRYEGIVLLDRSESFTEKNYLLPIASDEIKRNPKLTQTPGW
jgi:hypothetical protein